MKKRSAEFRLSALGSALFLALAGQAAFAAPTVNQMPGGGAVTATTGGGLASAVTVNGAAATGTIANLDNPSTIQLQNAGTVITWGASTGGVPTVKDTTNPQGFNLGSSAALTFDGAAPGASVLNIDASGNPSIINGVLSGQGSTTTTTTTYNAAVFVANANGVVVGPTGRLVLPAGGGLIGADMSSATAQQDFIANNLAKKPFIDVQSATGAITFGGAIVGDAVLNSPATQVLLAGSSVTNTGNVFTNQTLVLAGISAPQVTATVNDVATPVYRLATVTAPTTLQTWSDVGAGLAPLDLAINGQTVFGGTPGKYTSLVTTAGGTVTNTGSFSSNGAPVTLLGTGDVTSGTSGSTDQTVGLFSDSGLNVASSGGSVSLYNAVKGYTSGVTMPFLTVNAGNNVNVNALVIGSDPASIFTTGAQNYLAGNTATIGSSLSSQGSSSVTGKNVAINANMGAAGNITLTAKGTLGVASGATLTSDTANSGTGNIVITNGTNATTTTIAGTLNAGVTPYSGVSVTQMQTSPYGYVVSGPSVTITNAGNTASDLNISGPINSSSNITITSNGKLELANATAGLSGTGAFNATVYGTSAVLSGNVTAPGVTGPNGFFIYNGITYTANAATTNLTGTMTVNQAGGTMTLNALNFVGAPGYSAGSQLTADNIDATIGGNLNAPIAGNTNWLNNAITAAPFVTSSPLGLTLYAAGASRQSINVRVNGSTKVSSGNTKTTWGDKTPITSGFTSSGFLVGNGGSQLILNATGNLDSSANDFTFPGGVTFKAGGLLSAAGIYNAWTPVAQAYQGVFLEAPTIVASGLILTNGTSWVNFSTAPTGGVPNIYQMQPSTNTTNGNGFTANSYNAVYAPGAAHLNTYSSLITGGAVNTTPLQ